MASRLYRTEALVLRTYKLGEADRIVILVTPDHGKVRAVAKGVRKTTSKFGSRLEPLSHVSLQLYEGRNLHTITQAEAVDGFRPIREDLDKFAAASTVLEITDHLALEGEPDIARFRMLTGVLRTIAENDNPMIVPAFALKVLAHEGMGPEVTACVACGAGDPLVAIDLQAGGMLCPECRQGRAVSAEALRLLRAVLGGGLAGVLAESPSSAASEVQAIATEAIEQLIERRLRTPGILDRAHLPGRS